MQFPEYLSCERTYVTLRIYPTNLDPDEVTTRLGIQPTEIQRVGDLIPPAFKRTIKLAGWFLTSESVVESTNTLNHLAWLLDIVLPHQQQLYALQNDGHRMDVSCYWLRKQDQGGPTLTSEIMEQLSRLRLDIWFDMY
jgi:hypothetical protein